MTLRYCILLITFTICISYQNWNVFGQATTSTNKTSTTPTKPTTTTGTTRSSTSATTSSTTNGVKILISSTSPATDGTTIYDFEITSSRNSIITPCPGNQGLFIAVIVLAVLLGVSLIVITVLVVVVCRKQNKFTNVATQPANNQRAYLELQKRPENSAEASQYEVIPPTKNTNESLYATVLS